MSDAVYVNARRRCADPQIALPVLRQVRDPQRVDPGQFPPVKVGPTGPFEHAGRGCSQDCAGPQFEQRTDVISELLISRNLRCPQLVDQLEFRIGKNGGGGVELLAQVTDRFIVGSLSEMMQSHGQDFVFEVWN